MVAKMNIRPIDLQVLIPHTTEVSRTQAITNQQGIQQQQQFAEQFQKISADMQHQVQSTSKSVDGKVHREKDKNQEQQQSSGKQRDKTVILSDKEKEAVAKDEPDPIKGHIIDIIT